MNNATRLLVVEDDESLRESLAVLLRDEYDVFTAGDGIEGITMAKLLKPSIILLEARIPRKDGFSTVLDLRKEEETRKIPIVMLAALADVDQRVKAFQLGADDFITKPFEPDELLARLEAKVRLVRNILQHTKKSRKAVLDCGNLTADLSNLEVRVDGRDVRLSVLEFKILVYLIKHRKQLRSRRQILEAAWKAKGLSERLLDPHMLLIRRKLKGFDHEIASIYGGGYIVRPLLERSPALKSA
jgi:DNA-binding response OmpR family regulator